jgi:hypothetical protein
LGTGLATHRADVGRCLIKAIPIPVEERRHVANWPARG